MKKILMLTSSFPTSNKIIGGGEFVFTLSQLLSEDFKIYVLCPLTRGSKKYEKIDNIEVFRYKQFPIENLEIAYGTGIVSNIKKNKFLILIIPFFLISQFYNLVKIIKKYNIDIIHAHWIIPQGLVAAIYKKFFNKDIKILLTVHGSDMWNGNFQFLLEIRKFILKNVNSITVVSTHIKDIIKSYNLKKNIYVYPMGVDTDYFSPKNKKNKIREELGLKNKENLLLFVGYCTEGKGIRYLIESLPKVIDKFPSTKQVIIGEGELKSEMMQLVKVLNIEDKVVFLKNMPQDELKHYYSSADILILPSLEEGFGLVLTEAMSSGIYVIASDLPVFLDIIEDGATGFISKKGNPENLSKIINYIIENKERLTAVKINARKAIINKYTWMKVSENYNNIYQTLLNV